MAFALVGQTVEHFELLGPLGAGAMSEVYLGRDTRLDKKVAVKVINENLLRRPDLVERFEREARAAARLTHANVATVFFFGRTGDKPFYAMELIKGWSLGDIQEHRVSFTWGQILALFSQAAMGLHAAVDAGVLHRDIKPGNLMATEGGVLKIVDFGLAKLGDDKSLTRSGAMMGTPYYIAPEVVQGQGSDHVSDIYSFGVTMFHLLAGRPPYDAETPYGVMMQHISEPVPSLKSLVPDFPPALSDLVQAMMSKEPANRPQQYRDVAFALKNLADELGDRVDRPLAWCHFDKANTETDTGRCAACKRQRGAREVPEIFHVDLVGWNKNDAMDAVAGYIGKAVGQGPSEIRMLLDPLPFRAAFRVPRERARRMQRTFYELGADVSLVPADDESDAGGLIKDLPFGPVWPNELQGNHTANPLGSTTRTIRVKPTRSQSSTSPATIVAVVLGAVVLVLLGVLLGRTPPTPAPLAGTPTPAATPDPAATPEAGAPDAAEEEPIDEPTPTPEEGGDPVEEAAEPVVEDATPEPVEEADPDVFQTERVTLTGIVDPSYGPLMLGAFDRAAARVEELLGESEDRVEVELVDKPFRDWRKAEAGATIQFPIRNFQPGGLDPAASELMMRSVVSRKSDGNAPVWLATGLGGWLSEGPVDADRWPEVILRGTMPTELTSPMFLGTHEARETVRAFMTWLIQEKSWERIGFVLDYLGEGQDLDVATRRALGDQTFPDLEQLWMGSAGAGE